MAEDFLTVYDIADLLRVNPQTVRNWISRGELPAIRVGSRRVRVRRADFDAFLGARDESARTAGPDAAALRETERAESWSDFRAAMDRSQHVLDGGDQAALVAALRALASAAERLAGALG
jgi:excisionase family DNA binding protein